LTPSLFFRIVSWFTATVACLMGALAAVSMFRGEFLAGILLLVIAAVNVAGWRIFGAWSRQMRQ